MSTSTIIETTCFIYLFIGQVSCTAVRKSLNNINVFVALPRHESLCNLSTAIVKILLKMLHKINASVRHFV